MKMRVLGYSDISGTSRGREAKDVERIVKLVGEVHLF